MTEEILEKHSFIKTEKNFWAGYKDYLYNDLRNDYGYYLRATIHVPYPYKGEDIAYKMCKIIVHRYAYNTEDLKQWLEQRESEIVYVGLIPTEEYFLELLNNLGIK